jgi:carbon storage regulator
MNHCQPNQDGSKRGLCMLVLTRKLGESIAIDDNIKIVVVQIKGKQVRLGIKAPKETKIHREEVYKAIQDQNVEASQADTNTISDLADALHNKK